MVLGWVHDLAQQCQLRAEGGNYAVSRTKQWVKMLQRSYGEAEIFFSEIRQLNDFASLDALFLQRKSVQ